MGNGSSLKELIKKLALETGCTSSGVTDASGSNSLPLLYSWIENGLPEDLSYMSRDPSKRTDIKAWFPEAKSVLMCSFQYWNDRLEKNLVSAGISRYALSNDYHKTAKHILSRLLGKITKTVPGVKGKIFVDTSPVMEKPLAAAGGLGWQGKNTLLISRKQGSYFFLGGIALSVELPADVPDETRCGDCNLCIKACPTGALKEPGGLNPSLCISYWTTQHKGKIPGRNIPLEVRLRRNTYGCDACQEVCPYNKDIKCEILTEFQPIKKDSEQVISP